MARRGKRRDQLYVTVPSLFRCPISMDVMKSPVSLCTGVTYDRSSIEKWLSLGHNTCPATMQTLPSTQTTPNLTLRRLIHLWLSQAAEATSSPLTISKQQAADVIRSQLDSVDHLEKIVAFVRASDDNARFVATSSDAMSRLVECLSRNCGEVRICEMVVEILVLISPVSGVRERLSQLVIDDCDRGGDCLSSVQLVLEKGGNEYKVRSAKLLEMIASNSDDSRRRRVAEKEGLLRLLCSLLTAGADTVVEAGLTVLSAVSTSRAVKKDLIRFGIVRTIGEKILSCQEEYNSGALIEKALALLENVATCTEGRGAIADDAECVVGIVRRLMKCSRPATEHGITVLWSVCCLARDLGAQEKVVGVNGLTKVLLVMQSDSSAGARHMCRELVKVLRDKTAKSNLAPYETRTTHITPY